MVNREPIERRIRRQAKLHAEAGFDEFSRDLHEAADTIEQLRVSLEEAKAAQVAP